MSLQFPVQFEFKLSLFTELRVNDATGRLIAVVKEKKVSIRDEVRIFSDDSRRVQTHSIKAQGLLAGALDWKARRIIRRADGSVVGSLQAQGLRTMWGASYELLDATGLPAFTMRDDQPWLGVVEGLIDGIPFVGDFAGIAFDYLVNPTYTVTDTSSTPAYRIHKKRSWMSRRFTVEELRPKRDEEDELVLLGLVQLIMLERERG